MNRNLPEDVSCRLVSTMNDESRASNSLASLAEGMPNVLLTVPAMDDEEEERFLRRPAKLHPVSHIRRKPKPLEGHETGSTSTSCCCQPPSLPKRQRSIDWMDEDEGQEDTSSSSSSGSEESLCLFREDTIGRNFGAKAPQSCTTTHTSSSASRTSQWLFSNDEQSQNVISCSPPSKPGTEAQLRDDHTLATMAESLTLASSFTPNNSQSESSNNQLSLGEDDLVWLELKLEKGNAVHPLFCPRQAEPAASGIPDKKQAAAASAVTNKPTLTTRRRRSRPYTRRGQSDRHLELIQVDKRRIRLEKLKRHSTTGSLNLKRLLQQGAVASTKRDRPPVCPRERTATLLQQMEVLSEKLRNAQEMADRFDDDVWRFHNRDARWKSQW